MCLSHVIELLQCRVSRFALCRLFSRVYLLFFKAPSRRQNLSQGGCDHHTDTHGSYLKAEITPVVVYLSLQPPDKDDASRRVSADETAKSIENVKFPRQNDSTVNFFGGVNCPGG